MPFPRFVRENAFLVAAISLPLVVVGFFLVASVIPRWLVPPPAYDLILESSNYYDQNRPRVLVDFRVRDGRVQAVVRPVPPSSVSIPPAPKLFLFDHQSMRLREIPFEPPELQESEPAKTVTVDALAGRHVITDIKAPDGYELQTRNRHSAGIVGDLFGMRDYDERIALVNGGRVIAVELPQHHYRHALSPVGWIVDRPR
jgi:hypothetical protein